MTSMESLVATRVRELRTERGWSQAQLAERGRRLGMHWQPSTIAQFELGGQRADRLLDVAALCWIFGIGLDDLLAGEAAVNLPNGETAPLAHLRNALTGQVLPELQRSADDVVREEKAEMARIAARIKVPDRDPLSGEELAQISLTLFGNANLLTVRDERAEVTPETPARSAQARRGHATRSLITEIVAACNAEGHDVLLKRSNIAYDDAWQAHLSRTRPTASPEV